MIGTYLLSFGLAWQTASPEAVQHARAAMEAQTQGRMGDAISEFRKVTELAPELPAAFVNLGSAYLQIHDFGSAIGPLQQALKLNPDLVGAQQMLGIALLSQGYAAEAVPHLERANLPEAQGVAQLLGIAQLKTGKLPEAIANFELALRSNPNDPDLLYYLSKASGLLAKHAADTLESAFPASARAHQSLAENYAGLKRVPEAEKEYREALRINPNTPGLHLELGELYASAAEWAKAEEQFRAESKLQPGDAEAAYRLGSALLEEGKLQDAGAELKRADHLRPQMPETLYLLGKVSSLNGDFAAAENAWTQLLSIEKDGPLAAQAHFGLAGIYRKRNDPAKAAHEMQEFQRLRQQQQPPK